MIRVKYSGNYGYPETSFEDYEEFPDGTTDEEIEDYLKDLVYGQVDWNWEKESETE